MKKILTKTGVLHQHDSTLILALAWTATLDQIMAERGNFDADHEQELIDNDVCEDVRKGTYVLTQEATDIFISNLNQYTSLLNKYPTKVLIIMDGGLITAVSSSEPINVVVIDFDVEGETDKDTGKPLHAAVFKPHMDAPGTMEIAIEYNIEHDDVREKVKALLEEPIVQP